MGEVPFALPLCIGDGGPGGTEKKWLCSSARRGAPTVCNLSCIVNMTQRKCIHHPILHRIRIHCIFPPNEYPSRTVCSLECT